MTTQTIARKIAGLPPQMRQEVVNFIAFLRQRRDENGESCSFPKTPLSKDPFIGLWKSRTDLADSAKWVRGIRRRDWGN